MSVVELKTSAEEAVEWFNATHPVGYPVTAYPGFRPPDPGRAVRTVVRSEAWVLGGHTAVVMVVGLPGGIALSHIACADHATHDPAPLPEAPC